MNSILTITIWLVAIIATISSPASDIGVLKYETSTNYYKYTRNVHPTPEQIAKHGDYLFSQTQDTNVPAAIVHSITFGKARKPLFILKASEALNPPEQFDGWWNADYSRYFSGAWVVTPTNAPDVEPDPVESWTPKPGDRVTTGYGGTEITTVIDRVEYVGARSQTGILVFGVGLPGVDSFWVRPAPPQDFVVMLGGNNVTNDVPPFFMRELVETNQVDVGSATVGKDTFSLVALRMATNRVVVYRSPLDGAVESWTNIHLGPFFATNFVPRPPLNATNSTMTWGDLIITQPNLLNPLYIR